MDEFDIEILRSLQSQPAIRTTELADLVGLSQTPCWRQVKHRELSRGVRCCSMPAASQARHDHQLAKRLMGDGDVVPFSEISHRERGAEICVMLSNERDDALTESIFMPPVARLAALSRDNTNVH